MNRFKEVICLCAKNFLELLNSDILLDSEKKLFQKYVDNETEDNELEKSLFNISYFLYKHYHQKVIILIDEYDVPLQAAYQYNYIQQTHSAYLQGTDNLNVHSIPTQEYS